MRKERSLGDLPMVTVGGQVTMEASIELVKI